MFVPVFFHNFLLFLLTFLNSDATYVSAMYVITHLPCSLFGVYQEAEVYIAITMHMNVETNLEKLIMLND